ncbi:MAG: ABC transporter ATP-binding protein [Actinobacteria bacterium]|uniref:ABC transporter ATP-binding protein n=1 Tax=Candidatus Fonsibacter lacus TaxID=2576439 RepID=A0A965GCI3_9PROT|nr:ABC transporter ATP-binding protein [Candidatus Fonsibacter lacus]
MTMQAPWMMYRSMTQDQSVKNTKLKAGTLKRIISFATPYKKAVTFFLVTVVIDAVLVITTPLLLSRLIDDGVIPKNGTLVTAIALAIAALAILDAIMSIVGRWFSSQIGEGLIFDLRSKVFEHVQRQSIAFFTRTQTGALISRLNSDVIGAQQAFTSTLAGVVSNVLSLLLVLGALFYLSWQITFISLILVPLFLLPSRMMGRKIQELTRDSMNGNAEMSGMMTERFNVSGALLVSLYGNSKSESASFRSKARKVADFGIKIALANRIFFIGLTLVASISTAIAYGLGGHLAISGTISVGKLLAIAALLARLYGPLTALSNVRVDVMTALVSFERVFEVLDLEPMVTSPSNPKSLPFKTELTFSNVNFSYPKGSEVSLASLEVVAKPDLAPSEQILSNIDFSAGEGEMVALVGPSGAGKTTIISLIPRLYDVTSGKISIGGVDVKDLELSVLRQTVGVVTQDAHLFHDTIEGNLRYAKPDATYEQLERACTLAQIWDLVTSLPEGLGTMVGERGYRLSGGEKARLAIARLILKDPKIVLLDEATAHLDTENEALVQAAFKEVLKNRTSIVIAHRLSTVREADQILVLDQGQIIERGKHEELLQHKGLYNELYQRQFSE